MLSALWNAPAPLQWGVTISASLAAAICDVKTRRIPNPLTLAIFLSGIVWAFVHAGMPGVADGFLGCLLAAVPFVFLFVFAGGGAADAKLMGALGMWLGTRNALVLLPAVLIAGGILGIAYSLLRRNSSRVLANLLTLTGGFVGVATGQVKWREASASLPQSKNMLSMPYGLSILAGACVAARAAWLWKTGRIA